MNLNEVISYSTVLSLSALSCLGIAMHFYLQRQHHSLATLTLCQLCAAALIFFVCNLISYIQKIVEISTHGRKGVPSSLGCDINASISFFAQQWLFFLTIAICAFNYRAVVKLQRVDQFYVMRWFAITFFTAVASALYMGISRFFITSPNSQGNFTANCDLYLQEQDTSRANISALILYILPYFVLVLMIVINIIGSIVSINNNRVLLHSIESYESFWRKARFLSIALLTNTIIVAICWFARVLRIFGRIFSLNEFMPYSVPIDMLCNLSFLLGLIFYASFAILNSLRKWYESSVPRVYLSEILQHQLDVVYKSLLVSLQVNQQNERIGGARESLLKPEDSYEYMENTPALSLKNRSVSNKMSQNNFAAWGSTALVPQQPHFSGLENASNQFKDSSLIPPQM